MTAIIIENILACDLNKIYSIETNCYPNPWNFQNLETELVQPFAFNFKLSICDSLIGYTFASLAFENLQINNICIDRSYQINGYGSILMNHLLSEAKNKGAQIVTLEVNTNNFAALHLYKKLGFKKDRIVRMFYSNGDDAQIMLLFL